EVLPRQISGGQRQRVAIARALALEPQIIVADEPTSALDVSVRAQVLNLLMDLKRELGLGLVFISHDISTVRFVSDSIIVMNRGKVVEHDTAERIFTDAQDEYTRTLLAAAPSLL
ncbi:MAG: ATP-binding cassette domain-containing protein, partial [Brachybacterium tyrofermentans]